MSRLVTASILALALAAPASAATIVQNGSFEEDPGFVGITGDGDAGQTYGSLVGASGGSSWEIYSSLPGWTANAGSSGIEVQTANTIPLAPYHGNYYVELDGNQNTTIAQSIFLGVGRYVLSFAYSPRVNDITTNAISFGVSGLLADLVNGPGIGGTAIGQWSLITREFVVTTAGNYSLFFDAATQSDSLGGFIDNIKVAPVPVPAAGGLLLAGLVGLGALKRRRKTA